MDLNGWKQAVLLQQQYYFNSYPKDAEVFQTGQKRWHKFACLLESILNVIINSIIQRNTKMNYCHANPPEYYK